LLECLLEVKRFFRRALLFPSPVWDFCILYQFSGAQFETWLACVWNRVPRLLAPERQCARAPERLCACVRATCRTDLQRGAHAHKRPSLSGPRRRLFATCRCGSGKECFTQPVGTREKSRRSQRSIRARRG
jgi:hypothetical protein